MPSVVKMKIDEKFEDASNQLSNSGPDDDGVDGGLVSDLDTIIDEPTKKRKRDQEDEADLEIDVNLPEPPSKKALRKAKKDKETKLKSAERTGAKNSRTHAFTNTAIDATTSSPNQPTKSAYSIWIGNLPFSITKQMLLNFLATSPSISKEDITRVHIPPPVNAKATQTELKPQNKGFAYVDFASVEALAAAIALSESSLGGRNLLIKDAKSYAGRPEKAKSTNDAAGANDAKVEQKPPSRRVWVGNLSFDVTKEDLETHFKLCGEVENVHMATFEDTGKCKGFAWVTFAAESGINGQAKTGERAAGDAVQGFTYVEMPATTVEESDEDPNTGNDDTLTNGKKKHKSEQKSKKRKWFTGRLDGRPLKCEFAEDPSTRYKKRFGKEGERSDPQGVHPDRQKRMQPSTPSNGELPLGEVVETRPQQRRGKPSKDRKQVNAFLGDIRPGAPTDGSKRRGKGNSGNIEDESRYRTGAIAEATGKKTAFT